MSMTMLLTLVSISRNSNGYYATFRLHDDSIMIPITKELSPKLICGRDYEFTMTKQL